MSQSTRPSKPANRSSFIERTLVDINGTLEQSLFADQIARQKGFLQTLDPRLKVISTVLLLIAVNLSHSLLILVMLYFLGLGLAAISSVPLGFFIKRVWVFIPFFTGLVALPALFMTPGAALAHLPFGMIVTQTGLMTALFLILRVGTSVSFSVLLVLTTAWNNVLKALAILGVPDVITLILGITYRYIHLLLHLADELFLVRKSRILKRVTGSEERRLLAATSGTLLGKSLQISSEVYLSMQSRGFRYYPRTMDTFRMKMCDWISGAAVLMITGFGIWLGR
ncbi:MAG TPA: cobalt ECF transporter T component CbiQ [Anaerolineaceae bacterium]|nr:cobalt ECF transporter T component CbiQ [Anaerolineaceae bacterium]